MTYDEYIGESERIPTPDNDPEEAQMQAEDDAQQAGCWWRTPGPHSPCAWGSAAERARGLSHTSCDLHTATEIARFHFRHVDHCLCGALTECDKSHTVYTESVERTPASTEWVPGPRGFTRRKTPAAVTRKVTGRTVTPLPGAVHSVRQCPSCREPFKGF
jgi:hypothetical protein